MILQQARCLDLRTYSYGARYEEEKVLISANCLEKAHQNISFGGRQEQSSHICEKICYRLGNGFHYKRMRGRAVGKLHENSVLDSGFFSRLFNS